MNEFTVRLDLAKGKARQQQTVFVRQGDKNATTIVATITDHGVAASTSGLTARFQMRLPDGTHYYRKAASLSGSVATVTLDEAQAASAVGRTDTAYFQLLQGSTVVASTESFTVIVLPDALGDATVPESYDSAIQDAIDRMDDAVECLPTVVEDVIEDHPEWTTTVQPNTVADDMLVQTGGVLSEVHDIRTGADGTTYASAGKAVRTQLGALFDDVENDRGILFGGMHIERSQEYSGYNTIIVDVFVPKGAVCSFTNNGNYTQNFGVVYNGVDTDIANSLPTGETVRFIAAEDITRVHAYSGSGGTVNAFLLDVEPMWLGDEVESLEQRFMPENLFNADAEGVQSGWIRTDTGAINSSGSYSTSDFIPIEIGKTYSHPAAVSLYGATAASRIPCFDAEKNWVGYFSGTIGSNNILTFTVPNTIATGTGGAKRYNHVYTRFTYADANRGSVMFVEGAQPSEYVAYGAGKLATSYGLNQKQKDEVVELVGDSVSPLYGKKIAYNGDSICESRLNTSSLAYNGGAYAKIISDITGCTYENRAHSGGILASATGDGTTAARYVVSDVENMASDADLICFEGGINDYWTKVSLGTYSESDYTGTLDTTTICGALESIFRQATAKWVGKPICFVIVHKITSTVYTQNTQGYTFKDAHDAMLGICKKYAIPVFDAFEESGLNAYNSVQNTNFLTANANGTPDGCHPNEAGYRAFYVPQLIALFESLIARS